MNELEILLGLIIIFQLVNINRKVNKQMATQAEHAAALQGIATQLGKVDTEIQGLKSKISDLETALQNAGSTTPEVDAALQAVKDAVQKVDDEVPDAPTA